MSSEYSPAFQKELIEHHMAQNNGIVCMRVGSYFPAVAIHATGGRLKSRIESYFRETFNYTQFLIAPASDNSNFDKEEMYFASLEEAVEAMTGKTIYTALHTEQADLAVFGVTVLDTPTLDSVVLLRLHPVASIEEATAFAEKRAAINDAATDEERKALKQTAFDPFLELSPLMVRVAALAVEYCLDFIHSIEILKRYIASVYGFMNRVYHAEDLAANDALWATLTGKRVRIIAYPKAIVPALTSSIFARIDAEQVEGAAPVFELVPRDFTHVLFAFQAYGRVGYMVLPRGAWACPPPVRRQTTSVDSSSSWINTNACKGRVSRAYYKLEEVFAYLQQHQSVIQPLVEAAQTGSTSAPSRWGWWLDTPVYAEGEDAAVTAARPSAIDIGACPGGWSYSLAQRGARVLAVDPGLLSIQHALITHSPHQLQAPENVATMQARGPVDMVVCDINCDITMTTRIVLDHVVALQLLKPGAIVVLTVKSFAKATLKPLMDAAFERLAPYFDGLQSTWLLANRRERTIIGVRKPW